MDYPKSTRALLLLVFVMPGALLLGCSSSDGEAPTGDGLAVEAGDDAGVLVSTVLAPPGMELPYVVEPACPGEGCAYGMWLACGDVDVFATPDPGADVVATLEPHQWFRVDAGRVTVYVPEAVGVTRDTHQYSFVGEGEVFPAGDTVYVLDHLGEGFFNAWHGGKVWEIEIFWPWDGLIAGEDFTYGGEVLQAGRTAFWVNISSDGQTGWVRADDSPLAPANSLDSNRPICS